ncbi:ATPase component NikO of energizing module of nickel ECF transporter [Rhodovulum sp. PH10]|uniref:energy-coupling factor ABC transporter ATP-binding protein n=1 Tax=Rhodovulum sp. PH10 TaxID=1187851 RepID=UPI00027C1ED9|nr:ATPase component NikO of energizing module of nickel ECF transporter [Rhodovulum sp. PH10]
MTALFSLEGVTVARAGRIVLDGVSLALAPGERLALVGANGAGKTTLLRTLVGLEPPTAGSLVAFGRARRSEADFREVRLRAGFLFQDPDDQLFAPTVLEDVAFGPLNAGLAPDAAVARAKDTLARLNLAALEGRITHHLSGGEKRLVSLAGVLALEPDVLLLDEPTNALDAAHHARLLDILTGLAVAMIVVSHDRAVLERLATRAVLLENGKLSAARLHRHSHRHDHLHVHALNEAEGAAHADAHAHAAAHPHAPHGDPPDDPPDDGTASGGR